MEMKNESSEPLDGGAGAWTCIDLPRILESIAFVRRRARLGAMHVEDNARIRARAVAFDLSQSLDAPNINYLDNCLRLIVRSIDRSSVRFNVGS